jgi:uncharacterized protein (TIGR02246 family)
MRLRSMVCATFVCASLLLADDAFVQGATKPPAHARDEAVIRRIIQDEVAAWNAGDAKAYARHFAPDGTFTNIYGMVFEGRDEFEQRHAETFGSFFKGSQRRETIRRLKFIASTVALLDVDTEVRGFGPMPPGVATPQDGALRTRLQQVLVKQQSRWWIASYHNVAISPPQR